MTSNFSKKERREFFHTHYMTPALPWYQNQSKLLQIKKINSCLVAQTVKCLPIMWETWVRSLGWEDPLEKEKATNSSTLTWKIPWTEEPGRLQSTGLQRVGHYWATSLTSFLLSTCSGLRDLQFCFCCICKATRHPVISSLSWSCGYRSRGKKESLNI